MRIKKGRGEVDSQSPIHGDLRALLHHTSLIFSTTGQANATPGRDVQRWMSSACTNEPHICAHHFLYGAGVTCRHSYYPPPVLAAPSFVPIPDIYTFII